jgi:hypothetical protein
MACFSLPNHNSLCPSGSHQRARTDMWASAESTLAQRATLAEENAREAEAARRNTESTLARQAGDLTERAAELTTARNELQTVQ